MTSQNYQKDPLALSLLSASSVSSEWGYNLFGDLAALVGENALFSRRVE